MLCWKLILWRLSVFIMRNSSTLSKPPVSFSVFVIRLLSFSIHVRLKKWNKKLENEFSEKISHFVWEVGCSEGIMVKTFDAVEDKECENVTRDGIAFN